jgi:aminoglycoside 3-N-acetyltransferase
MTAVLQSEFVAAVRQLGVAPTDVVMVHSNVSRLLKMPVEPGGLAFFRDALLAAVPSGTVVVPTFSYRFCESGAYDAARTPSEVGLFSEFFRRDPRAVRSSHPIFSVAAIGADIDFVCRRLSHSSYGAGSVFERLYAADAKLLHFDVPLADACTFAHFPEQKTGVPYRYSKHFQGTSTVGGKSTEGDWELYVRATERWDFLPQPADELVYPKDLTTAGHSRHGTWAGLPLVATSCRGIFDVIIAGIQRDPYYMLSGRPLPKRPQGQAR